MQALQAGHLAVLDQFEEWQRCCREEAANYSLRHVPPEERVAYARATSLRQFWEECGPRWEPIGHRKRSRGTIAKDRQALNRWERFTEPASWPLGMPWPGPTLQFLESVPDQWLAEVWEKMEAGGLSRSTVDSTRGHLLTMFRHAVKVGAIERAPGGPREKATPRTRVYTPADVQAVLEAFEVEPLLRGAFWLCLHIGPRTEDLFLLKWEQVIQDHRGRRLIDYKALKTGKLQAVPLADCVWQELEPLRTSDPYLFPGLSNPACADPEKSYEARLRNKLAKRLMARAGIEVPGKPWQVARATCNERFESHRPGVGQFILGHALGGVNARNYREPTEAVHEAVRSLPPYTAGLQRRLF